MAQIKCKDLVLGYGGTALVPPLNFEVNPGDYLCILGENGAGKSTLMRTLLKLQSPISGSIETGDGLKATEIGYLPQQTIVQKDFPASVREIVLSGCQGHVGLRPFYRPADKKLAEDAMARLGITHLSKRCYRELSGGQQQRVLLARALCATQKLLLLDEPVSGLDPKATADMYDMIEDLNRTDHTTIIMISHNVADALRYATHILHVGKEPFFGTRRQYLESKQGRQFTHLEAAHE